MSFVESQTTPKGQPKASDNSLYVRPSSKTVGLRLTLHGAEFTADPNTVTKHQLKFNTNIELVGALFKVIGAHSNDYVDVKIVDVDNILGYGNNVELAQFAYRVPGHLCTTPIAVESTTSDIIYQGLYMSLEYTNAGSDTVDVHLAYKYYK